MSDFLGGGNSIEDLSTPRSDVNQITEEAVARVQEQSRKAKQIAQQIKKDKTINAGLSAFLTFLFREIKNDKILAGMYQTFFKARDPKEKVMKEKKDINSLVMVGFFYPFFREKAQELNIHPFFEKITNANTISTPQEYITYLQDLSEQYHDNVPIEQTPLITLLIYIIQEFLPKEKNHQPLSHEELQKFLTSELYGI